MNKPKIILDNTGEKLYEGRCRGIAYAFLKEAGEGVLEMCQPFSPCKDYLNDVLYSAVTGKDYQACGLDAKPHKIFGEHAYIAFSDRQHSCSGDATKFILEESKIIPKDFTFALKVMHEIEGLFKIEKKTEIIPVEVNLFVAKIAPEWAASTWMVSLWSLLMRNAVYATGEGDAITELKKSKDADVRSHGSIVKIINSITKNGLPTQDFEKQGMSHGYGIMYWLGKYAK